jgi:c-di-GMP-binding flagellar brake protein YcgR
MKNGAKNHRAGCMFINLHSSQQAMIQRYIIKLDRERRSILAQ